MNNVSVQSIAKEELVGDIELKHAIDIQALTQSDRTQTFCCFIDAVEPKQDDPLRFPDEIFVSYRVEVNYLKDGANVPSHDDDVQLALHLPITIIPAQMPKIVSAGMAFSKYVRDKNYANTEARKNIYGWSLISLYKIPTMLIMHACLLMRRILYSPSGMQNY